MTLPSNIQPGTDDIYPNDVFLVPVCTTREAVREITYALDLAYQMTGKILVIKDWLNALQYVANPQDAICMTEEPPQAPVVTTENDGDCVRVLVDGVAVTGWICPPETEPPPPPPTPPTVGVLGLTLEELESIIMGCLNLNGSLRWNNGVLQMRTCDGWENVPGMVAPVQTSASQALSDGMSYATWAASGSPEIPEQPAVPSSDPLFNTLDSLRCAKATVLYDTLIEYLLNDAEAVELATESGNTLIDVMSFAAAFFLGAGYALLTEWASNVWQFKGTALANDYESDVQALALSDETRSSVICELASLVSAPVQIGAIKMNRVTAQDIAALIETLTSRELATEAIEARLAPTPILWLAQKATSNLDTAECGCDDLLPYGYVPPAAPGFRFTHYGFAHATVSTGNPNVRMQNNVPFEAAFANPMPGSLVGGYPRGGYLGNDSGANYTGFSWVIQAPETFMLAQVAFDMVHDAAAERFLSGVSYFNPTTNLWVSTSYVQDLAAPLDTTGFRNIANQPARYIIIHLHTGDTAPGIAYSQISAIRISGSVNGVPFADLGLNEVIE